MMVRRGDVYYADLAGSVGSEQGGLRPVVVIQNDKGNRFSPTLIVAPTHVILPADSLEKASIVLLEQIRTIDKQRLGQWVCSLDRKTLQAIDEALCVSLGLEWG